MLSILTKISKNRLLVAVISFAFGGLLGWLLSEANVTNSSSILKWSLGFGVFGVLYLHAKSYFSTESLGWHYTRLYGAAFGLIYTSFIFLMFNIFYAGETNEIFNLVSFSTVISTALYNFLINNYAGVEKEHLIARKLLEQQMEKDKQKKDGACEAPPSKNNKENI